MKFTFVETTGANFKARLSFSVSGSSNLGRVGATERKAREMFEQVKVKEEKEGEARKRRQVKKKESTKNSLAPEERGGLADGGSEVADHALASRDPDKLDKQHNRILWCVWRRREGFSIFGVHSINKTRTNRIQPLLVREMRRCMVLHVGRLRLPPHLLCCPDKQGQRGGGGIHVKLFQIITPLFGMCKPPPI